MEVCDVVVSRCCFEGRDGFVVRVIVLGLVGGWETGFGVADVEVVCWGWDGWVLLFSVVLVLVFGFCERGKSATYVCEWI